MKQLLQGIKTSIGSFVREEEGAQVIEYALIIAVVSIALVLGLQGLNGNFQAFIARVAACLTGGACTAGGGGGGGGGA
ncbi:MAG TPA: Flp family type IVb pilin [Noviherbaspirillum sp.]|uniref:Flp family type IVb pilin n=1 Tax=Noviherbaspirillum sp. TaxID=1926288 RepID=UPI002D67B577|nr:Flp family type IVb pilin [Noviherbaspirillum sp.]HYD95488.1 Flp family type IVb pilin [Noviherbaspirillum sp.]